MTKYFSNYMRRDENFDSARISVLNVTGLILTSTSSSFVEIQNSILKR